MQEEIFREVENETSFVSLTETNNVFPRIRDESFDFKGVPASLEIYGIHPYPAMFHFLVVRKLLHSFSSVDAFVMDPFMGSGVVAGECLISGRNFIGFDINPLAVLITKVRTTPISGKLLLNTLESLSLQYMSVIPDREYFKNIKFWFDEETIFSLSKLKKLIFEISDPSVRNFFLVVFSETVRRVSKTKFNEYKLLRRKSDFEKPNVLLTFQNVAERNISRLTSFFNKYSQLQKGKLQFYEMNILDDIPVKDKSIDLVITSPPYGDSKTTVPYGQFSRLSLQWLGIDEKVDKFSLGSKLRDSSFKLPSKYFYQVFQKIITKDEKRAKEVFAFFYDLFLAINVISLKVKPNGYVCFVVGNRKVKGIEIPTDLISVEFFELFGLKHHKTIVRAISNKRIPMENSPSNIKGAKDSTMKYEYILILQKLG